MSQLLLDLGPAPAPGFDNFWVGPNAAALDAVKNLRPEAAKGFQSLVLWGEIGSGRSHLLTALQSNGGWLSLDPDSPLAAFRTGDTIRAVVLDDLDLFNSEQLQAAFVLWAELHARADQGTALAASLSQSPSQWLAQGGRPDLGSRLSQALVFELKPLSDAQKTEALRDKFAERGLSVGDEVLDYLLTRLPRSMAALVAAVDALDQLGWQHKRAITLALLRQWRQQGGLE